MLGGTQFPLCLLCQTWCPVHVHCGLRCSRCCGDPHLHAGQHRAAISHSTRSVAAVRPRHCGAVLLGSAGGAQDSCCGSSHAAHAIGSYWSSFPGTCKVRPIDSHYGGLGQPTCIGLCNWGPAERVSRECPSSYLWCCLGSSPESTLYCKYERQLSFVFRLLPTYAFGRGLLAVRRLLCSAC